MSESNSNDLVENNYYPLLIAVVNFSVLLTMAMQYMANTVELWDFIFVGAGVYFSMKFVRLMRGAHEYPETRINPNDRDSFPTEGVYDTQPGRSCVLLHEYCICLFYQKFCFDSSRPNVHSTLVYLCNI